MKHINLCNDCHRYNGNIYINVSYTIVEVPNEECECITHDLVKILVETEKMINKRNEV